MSTVLDQLRAMTTVVADSGDLEAIRHLKPEDATTNPSLILKAVDQPYYQPLIDAAVAAARAASSDAAQQLTEASDRLIVAIGCQLLKVIPGKISTEVDARLSFDTAATITKAQRLIALYDEAGVSRDRVLIKIASTWEGIQAAAVLEAQGIHCNLTLLFAMAQAVACAEAGAFLISPFVGRILDWYKAKTGRDYTPAEDPGVQSVTAIYRYYKEHGYPTVVMGASFRSADEVLALAGCDRLTISPALLEELARRDGTLVRQLSPVAATAARPAPLTEAEFRWQMNEDAMATDKLAEGIRQFAVDQRKLETRLAALLA